jgi:hypothetical protein
MKISNTGEYTDKCDTCEKLKEENCLSFNSCLSGPVIGDYYQPKPRKLSLESWLEKRRDKGHMRYTYKDALEIWTAAQENK